jgi:hypothetical protein
VLGTAGIQSEASIANVITEISKSVTKEGALIRKGDKQELGRLLARVIVGPDQTSAEKAPVPSSFGAKYKPVDKKKNPIPVSVPTMRRAPYKPIPIPIIPKIPTHPPRIDELQYTERLSRERIDVIVSNVSENFLTEEEMALLLWVLFQNEEAIAFEDSERGTYKPEYYPDYVMETIPHIPWRLPPIRIAESIKGEMIQMLKNQMDNGNLEPSTASYRSRVFAIQKPHNKGLRIVHDLQPLNAVSIQDSMLPPNVSEFAEGFIGHAILYMGPWMYIWDTIIGLSTQTHGHSLHVKC